MSLKMEHDIEQLKKKRQKMLDQIKEGDPLYPTLQHILDIIDPIIERGDKALETKKGVVIDVA